MACTTFPGVGGSDPTIAKYNYGGAVKALGVAKKRLADALADQMDFGAAAARYIDAFFRNIQWETVLDRLEAATRPAGAGR